MRPERSKWNDLYARALGTVRRPSAEIDSVPLPERWGVAEGLDSGSHAFLLPYLARASRWVDLGCGTGSVLAALLRRFPAATGVGIDISDVAIDIGRRELMKAVDLLQRMELCNGDYRVPTIDRSGAPDMIFALYSLQFLRLSEFNALARLIGTHILSRGGIFAGIVRSTSRSIPASYIFDASEKNTFISDEPHEQHLLYHHYSEEELRQGAVVLQGRIVKLHETFDIRPYDLAPKRAWWNFVIEKQ